MQIVQGVVCLWAHGDIYSMVIHIFIWICMDFEMASITKVAENVSDNEEAEVI